MATVDVSSAGSSIGTGGMVTKLIAAELAGSAGCSTVITLGSRPQDVLLILDQILQGGTDVSFQPSTGTLFVAPPRRLLEDRKWWILHGLSPAGVLTIDAGAARALSTKGSLFAAGITHLEGTFNSQQAVRILGPNGKDIARGIVNYTSLEIARIKGAQSSAIMDILGYCETEEVVHRNNLALLVDQTPKEEQESMMP